MANQSRREAAFTTKSIPDGVWAYCSECGKETHHDVLACICEHDSSDDADIQVWNTFETVQCRGCRRVGFRTTGQCTEDQEYDPFTGEIGLITTISLYPDSERSRRPIDKSYQLPGVVRRVYQETLIAASNDLRVLVGIGIRAIVESVCKERSAKGSNLEKRIDDLVDQGFMPRPAADLLHGTRLLGNRSAHEAEPLTLESLQAALDVIDHLLQTVYLMPGLGTHLPKPKPRPAESRPRARQKKPGKKSRE